MVVKNPLNHWPGKKRGIIYSFFELILYYGPNNVAELFCKVNGKSTNA